MTPRHAIVAIVLASCATGDAARPPQPSPARRTTMSQPGYPNVHVRLRVAQRAPAIPPRDSELEIWLLGTRFHVRDLTGQMIQDILGDVAAPRQLGVPARTIEDMMDRHSEAQHPEVNPRPTELFGDLATGNGWVYPSEGDRKQLRATRLAPAAEQILARDKANGLTPGASSTRLGRAATEYRGVVTVTEDGEPYHNAVTRVIAPPYLLLEDIHDAANPGRSYVREIIALDEGSVTDADLTPPAP
jgi:hypothetical protein